ncbi:MAG: OmpA family protein [Pseudomonadota bacterium]
MTRFCQHPTPLGSSARAAARAGSFAAAILLGLGEPASAAPSAPETPLLRPAALIALAVSPIGAPTALALDHAEAGPVASGLARTLAAADAPAADWTIGAFETVIRRPARLTAEHAANEERAVLYFALASARLDPASRAKLADLASLAPARSVIEIIGHADRAGAPDRNLRLSRLRAEAVRADLIALIKSRRGDAPSVKIRALGERAPAVRTADGVREPRNRRVEIHVRRL